MLGFEFGVRDDGGRFGFRVGDDPPGLNLSLFDQPGDLLVSGEKELADLFLVSSARRGLIDPGTQVLQSPSEFAERARRVVENLGRGVVPPGG